MSRRWVCVLALTGCDFALAPGGSSDAPMIDTAIDSAIDARAPDHGRPDTRDDVSLTTSSTTC